MPILAGLKKDGMEVQQRIMLLLPDPSAFSNWLSLLINSILMDGNKKGSIRFKAKFYHF